MNLHKQRDGSLGKKHIANRIASWLKQAFIVI